MYLITNLTSINRACIDNTVIYMHVINTCVGEWWDGVGVGVWGGYKSDLHQSMLHQVTNSHG